MKIPVIPDWCKGLPDSTMLFSCDIIEFFGYKNKSDVSVFVNKGYIPQPISLKGVKLMRGNKRATNRYWLLGDIRKLRAELLK